VNLPQGEKQRLSCKALGNEREMKKGNTPRQKISNIVPLILLLEYSTDSLSFLVSVCDHEILERKQTKCFPVVM
jgi:hypothetical protein